MSYSPADYAFERRIPDGDGLERLVCRDCGWIHYENPKLIVGAVCVHGESILLCKRAIEPRSGYWTIPAGFMEQNETAEEGAAREAMEEAFAQIEIDCLIGVYSIPRISQVHLIYRASLLSPDVKPGPESEEVDLLSWGEIPWSEIAFPSVEWALRHFHATREETTFAPFSTPIDEIHRRLPPD